VVPTLADIGAVGLLAHRVQALLTYQAFQATIAWCAWRSDLKPAWFRTDRRLLGTDATSAEEGGRHNGGAGERVAWDGHVGDVSVSPAMRAMLRHCPFLETPGYPRRAAPGWQSENVDAERVFTTEDNLLMNAKRRHR
jgi:hypothetical protein